MDFTGKPLRGFVYVDPEVCTDGRIAQWLERALAFNASLLAK